MKSSKKRSKQSATVSQWSPDISVQESEAERTARYCRAMEEHWRALEKMYWILRPNRSDPVEKLQFSLKSAFAQGRTELDSILDEIYGVRVVDHLSKTVERTRVVNIDRDGGFYLIFYLILSTLLDEASALYVQRSISGLLGTHIYNCSRHHPVGKPCPTGNKKSILYRSLRLAFFQLRSAPKRFASILEGDLSEQSVLEILAGWGLSKSPFSKRKRLMAVVGRDNRELQFMAALAYSLAERTKGQRFFVTSGKKMKMKKRKRKETEPSVFRQAIRQLEQGSCDAARGRRVVSQEEVGELQAGERRLTHLLAGEEFAELRRRAGLEQNPLLDLLQAGYNGPEIARKLGMKSGAVRAAKLRLLKKLQAVSEKDRDSE